jgi:hypothetical protein
MRPQRVDRFGPVVHELLASAEHDGPGLLFRSPRLDLSHGRWQRCLNDRFRVGRIILLPLDELDVARRDRPDLVAELLHLARPVVRSTACLHRDDFNAAALT